MIRSFTFSLISFLTKKKRKKNTTLKEKKIKKKKEMHGVKWKKKNKAS